MDAPDAPTLTEKAVPVIGTPGVEVYFPTLDSDAETITVWRIADGVREEVRGADGADCAGDFVVTDWEVPFGVETVYVAEIFDAGGASITGAQGTITVDKDEVWFQDPVDPELAFRVRLTADAQEWLTAGASESVVRTRRTSKQFVFGKYRPFLQNFGLGAIEQLQMDVVTEDEESVSLMRRLQRVSPIVVRTPPQFASLPRVLSADVPVPTNTPLDYYDDGFTNVWLLRLDEVEPVAKAIIRPLITWGDWEDAFPDDTYIWSDVETLYSAGTWTDAVRNPPNA